MSQFTVLPTISIVATNPSVGTNGAGAPASSTQIAGKTAGGLLVPVLVESNGAVDINAAALPLPTGAATSALQVTGNAVLGSILLDLTNGTQITQVTGTVPLPTGAATSALQTTGNTSLSSIDGKTPALGQALSAASVPVVLPATQITALTPPTTVTVTQGTAANLNATVSIAAAQTLATVTTLGTITNPLPAGTNLLGKVGIDQTTVGTTNAVSIAQIGANTVLTGSGTTGTGSIRVTQAGYATSTITSVAGSITSVTLLAANTARAGAMIFNDSTQILYVALASSASVTAYTVQIAPNGYYELPNTRVYNGIITGIQSSANGNARVTEIT